MASLKMSLKAGSKASNLQKIKLKQVNQLKIVIILTGWQTLIWQSELNYGLAITTFNSASIKHNEASLHLYQA